MSTFDPKLVTRIAMLAKIPLKKGEEVGLAKAFADTLDVISNLKELDTSKVRPTFQVTGLTNILRDDLVIESESFSQADALKNANKTHNGYFLVPQVIDKG